MRNQGKQMAISAAVAAMSLAAFGHAALAQGWEQTEKLRGTDGATGDLFGRSVSVSEGIVAVGTPEDDDNGDGSGSVYLFDISTGAQIAKLLPDDGDQYDEFGGSIAVGEGVVAVGAPNDDDNGGASGSAYLFDVSTGAQIAKLLAQDGKEFQRLGTAIAMNDGVVAVSAHEDDANGKGSGSAYLFDISTGAQIAKLLPKDGDALDYFSLSLAVSDGVVVVGAPFDDDNGVNSGSAYLFNVSTGMQFAKLLAPDGEKYNSFGYSVAIADGVVAVGAPLNDN